MRLILDNSRLNEAPENILRRAGYAFLIDRRTGNESFVRPLNRGYYPRFHLYLDRQNNKVILNLHLDQKQASYAGAHAHNAEYDGETVENEMQRIKDHMAHNLPAGQAGSQPATQNANTEIGNEDILDRIRPKNLSLENKKTEEKKSWWKFWK